mmetsp:Transcript_42013/g.87911  ORF Transcript_42013/g.87911 Transcript_42013/m.87911 type:complete len:87 (-) Transcript_42013:196-456(-)
MPVPLQAAAPIKRLDLDKTAVPTQPPTPEAQPPPQASPRRWYQRGDAWRSMIRHCAPPAQLPPTLRLGHRAAAGTPTLLARRVASP